jgi:hypothetical protein
MKENPLTTENKIDMETEKTDRRGFLGKLGKAAIVGASIGAVGAKPFLDGKSSEVAAQRGNTLTVTRAQKAFRWRSDVALQGYQATSPTIRHNSNFDESLYPNRIANYSKGLPHDADGEVIGSAYEQFMQAVRTGSPADFELIPMGGTRKLTSPQSGLAFDLQGGDAHSFVMPPAPAFASRRSPPRLRKITGWVCCATCRSPITRRIRLPTPPPPIYRCSATI